MNRFALILTHNRAELLAQCVAAIGPQVQMIVVIDNASDPPARVEPNDAWQTLLIPVPEQPPNISKMWNVGIRAITDLAESGSHLAVICDDTAPVPGWFDAVVAPMPATGAVVGCSDPFGYLSAGQTRVKTEPDGALMERMPGHAWVLDLDSPVRPDDALPWWWGDTDIDWQARRAGGMVMIGGYPVPNIRPNENTVTRPELNEQAGRDGEVFAAKWGWRPW